QRPRLAKIAQNVAWLSLDQVLRMGLGMLVGVWAARYLGPEQFGKLNYAIAFVGLFAAVGSLGLQPIVVREIVRRGREPGVILGSAIALQLGGGLLALLLALSASLVFSADDAVLRASVAILCITLPFRASDTVRYWFESQVESRYVVWVENGIFLLACAARIGLILAEASLLAFVVLAMLETVLVSVGLLCVYFRRVGAMARWRVELAAMRALLTDSWPYFLAAVSVTLYMRMDIVMLQQMSSSHEVGVYSAAARISELLYVVPMILIGSISPALIALHQEDRRRYLGRMQRLYAAGWWFAVAASAVLCLLAAPLVGLAFGRDFADAGGVLAIHVWGSIAVVHGITSSQHLLVENLQKVSLYRTLTGLCCNFILNAAAIPLFGAKGAACATVISYFVSTYSLVLFRTVREHALFMMASPFRRGDS
ncbi:MAG TPA: flippase, partial [Ramlibacter sp.]